MHVIRYSACCCQCICDVLLPSLSWFSSVSFPYYHPCVISSLKHQYSVHRPTSISHKMSVKLNYRYVLASHQAIFYGLLVDTTLNETCRLITGCIRPTATPDLYVVNYHETASSKFLVSAPFNIFFIMMHMKCMCAY